MNGINKNGRKKKETIPVNSAETIHAIQFPWKLESS